MNNAVVREVLLMVDGGNGALRSVCCGRQEFMV
jgi:hypothetical protein